MNSSLKLSDV